MPFWISVYFALYCTLCAAGLWDDYRDHRPWWHLAFDAAAGLILAFLFYAYWRPTFLQSVGGIAPVTFLLAMGWEVYAGRQDFLSLRSDPKFTDGELTESQQTLSGAITIVIMVVLLLPVFIISGIVAFTG